MMHLSLERPSGASLLITNKKDFNKAENLVKKINVEVQA